MCWFRGSLLCLLAVAVTWPCGAARASVQEDDRASAIADAYVREQVARGVVGVQVALVHDGRVVHTAAAGDAGGGRSMTPSTPSRLESVSKSITSLAVMQLVDRGRLDLDRPVRDYLPELRIDDDRAVVITVRQLLTHTSGLADRSVPDSFPDGPRTLAQRVRLLADAHLAAAPGTEFHYVNANYAVLARTVEVVSGERFGDHLRRQVFAPLGMDDTVDTARADATVPGMATGHVTAFGRGFAATGPDYFVDGSGGVVSTAEDLARWLAFQSGDGRAADGTRIVSAAAMREMHRPQTPDGADYALGWYRAESAEGPPVRTSHSGAGAGYGAYAGLFTGSGWSVGVLVDQGAGLTAADPAVLGQNLVAAVDHDVPTLGGETHGLRTDLVLSVLLLLSVCLAMRGTVRSRRWAERRRGRSGVVTVVRLLPLAAVVALVAAVPSVQLALTDRAAPWPVLFAVEPVAVVWLLAGALGALVVLTTRLRWLLPPRGYTGSAAVAPGTGR